MGLFHYNIITNFIFVIGVIVANVPEAMLISVSLCLTLAAKKMAKKNVLVKNLESVETLGSCRQAFLFDSEIIINFFIFFSFDSTICSDKTGTLTLNQMTVQHLWYNGEVYKASHIVPGDEPLFSKDNAVAKMLTNIACLCNRAQFKDESLKETIGDASESGLIKFLQPLRDINEWRNANQKLVEIPFNSVNKFQVSVHRQEGGVKGHLLVMKGAPERIVARCSHVSIFNEQSGKAEDIPITEEWQQQFQVNTF